MPIGQNQSTNVSKETRQLADGESSTHIYTSAKYTSPKLIKQQKFKRLVRHKKDSSEIPFGAIKLNNVIIYLFSGAVMGKYGFLEKANMALQLAVELLEKKEKGGTIEDSEYFFFRDTISKIEFGHQNECARLPMNRSAKTKYQKAIAQLHLALEMIY